jgi:hypothetical protein
MLPSAKWVRRLPTLPKRVLRGGSQPPNDSSEPGSRDVSTLNPKWGHESSVHSVDTATTFFELNDDEPASSEDVRVEDTTSPIATRSTTSHAKRGWNRQNYRTTKMSSASRDMKSVSDILPHDCLRNEMQQHRTIQHPKQ